MGGQTGRTPDPRRSVLPPRRDTRGGWGGGGGAASPITPSLNPSPNVQDFNWPLPSFIVQPDLLATNIPKHTLTSYFAIMTVE